MHNSDCPLVKTTVNQFECDNRFQSCVRFVFELWIKGLYYIHYVRISGGTLPLRARARQLDTEASDIHTVCCSNCLQDGKDTFHVSEHVEGRLQRGAQIIVKKMIICTHSGCWDTGSLFEWFSPPCECRWMIHLKPTNGQKTLNEMKL